MQAVLSHLAHRAEGLDRDRGPDKEVNKEMNECNKGKRENVFEKVETGFITRHTNMLFLTG